MNNIDLLLQLQRTTDSLDDARALLVDLARDTLTAANLAAPADPAEAEVLAGIAERARMILARMTAPVAH